MIFSENLNRTNSESIKDGINRYSVIVDQLADNLHDLCVVADSNNKNVAKQVNAAETEIRKASIILAKLVEDLENN